jgi:hypothetical protein
MEVPLGALTYRNGFAITGLTSVLTGFVISAAAGTNTPQAATTNDFANFI